MRKDHITNLFSRLQGQNPKPNTELIYHSEYQLLVAVVLSAQATDKSVNKATENLFAAAPDAQSMVKLSLQAIEHYIQTIGLYHTKAKNVLALSQQLIEKHHGEVPNNRAYLEALPGVGRKTANVILNTLFNEPVIAVDTHIFRVANRTGLAKGKTVLEVEKKLDKCIPKPFKLYAHHWLILHGRYTCMARKPLCEQCLVNDLCLLFQSNHTKNAKLINANIE